MDAEDIFYTVKDYTAATGRRSGLCYVVCELLFVYFVLPQH